MNDPTDHPESKWIDTFIDSLCDRFEAALRSGERPRIEDYLTDLEPSKFETAVRELLALELDYRQRAGDTPQKTEYLDRFPDFPSVVDTVFGDSNPKSLDESTQLTHDHAIVPPPESSKDSPPLGERYQRDRILGEGGLGRVWIAIDHQFDRPVALKELQPEWTNSRGARERFLREANITGQLSHPNIVPVYEVTESDGNPVYTMRIVEGETLAERIFGLHSSHPLGSDPVRLRELLSAFVGVCQAVAYAHSRNVIHRDLKPANVVLGEYGEVVLLDWGLAKKLAPAEEESDSLVSTADNFDLTSPGTIAGTLPYLAPEQARGETETLDERTDVFGLGAVLFEVLTGRRPRVGTSAEDLLRQAQNERLSHPKAIDSGVPGPLASICAKATAFEPEERYRSANALLEDVRQWMADEPVTAHREALTESLLRWSRRHRTWVLGLSVAAPLIVLTLVLALIFVEMARRGEQTAKTNEQQAKRGEQARADLFSGLYYRHSLALARRYWDSNQVGRAERTLLDCPSDRRGIEWEFLRSLCELPESETTCGNDQVLQRVTYGSDSKLRVLLSDSEGLNVWTAEENGVYHSKGFVPGRPLSVSDRGSVVAYASQTSIHVVDFVQGSLLATIPAPEQGLHLQVGPNGKTLAVVRWKEGVRSVWRLGLPEELSLELWQIERKPDQTRRLFRGTLRGIPERGIALASDKPLLAALGNGRVHLIDTETGKAIRDISASSSFEKPVNRPFAVPGPVSISDRGEWLAWGGADGAVYVWSNQFPDRAVSRIVSDDLSLITSLLFLDSSSRLLVARESGSVELWDANSGRFVDRLRGRSGPLRLAVTRDGARLASWTDSVLRIWSMRTQSRCQLGDDPQQLPYSLETRKNREAVVVFRENDNVAILPQEGPEAEFAKRKLAATFRSQTLITGLASDKRTGCLAVSGIESGHGIVRLLGEDRPPKEGRDSMQSRIGDVTFHPSLGYCACGTSRGRILFFDSEGEVSQEPWSIDPEGVIELCYSGDGKRLAASIGYHPLLPYHTLASSFRIDSSTTKGALVVLDSTSGEHICRFPIPKANSVAIAFDSHGERLYAGCTDGSLRCWRIGTGQDTSRLVFTKAHRNKESSILSLAVGSGDARIVTGATDGRVTVWNRSGAIEAEFSAGRSPIVAVRFHPSQPRLATCSRDGSVRIFETSEWTELVSLPAEQLRLADDTVTERRTYCTEMEFHDRGRHLAIAREDGRVILLSSTTESTEELRTLSLSNREP